MYEALIPTRFTADRVISEEPCQVHWLSFYSSDDVTILTLRNGVNTTGSVVWDMVTEKEAFSHFRFDPPIKCYKGLFADVDSNFTAGTVCTSPIEPD